MVSLNCTHNQICRYTHGFFCEDCGRFFDKASPTYRSGELLSNIWMVLHNINASRVQDGMEINAEVLAMRDKIGVGVAHENYEELIMEAEPIMAKHSCDVNSAAIILSSRAQ